MSINYRQFLSKLTEISSANSPSCCVYDLTNAHDNVIPIRLRLFQILAKFSNIFICITRHVTAIINAASTFGIQI